MMGFIRSISFASVLLSIAVQSVKKYFIIRTRKTFEPGGIRTHAAGAAE